MKTVIAPQTGPELAATQAVLPLLIEAALLALHFALPEASPWREPLLLLLALPMVLAALSGTRTAAAAIALSLLLLANDIAPFDADTVAAEAVFLSAAGLLTWQLARAAEREHAANERVLAETRQRAARLRDTYGHWPRVALTRMGGYATGIEERFLDDALRDRPGGTIVDVGAASGRLEHALTSHARHVIATDIDRDEVYAMAEDAKVTPAVVSALPALPVRDRSIDTVVAIEVPAASEADWFRAECARVLREDGRVLLTVLNAWSYKGLLMRLRNFLRRSGSASWRGIYYTTSVTEQLRQWREAGFEPVRRQGFYWTPLARDSQSPWVTRGALLERVLGLRHLLAISPWVLVELRLVDGARAT